MLEVSEQPQMTEMNQKPIDMETRIENELNGRDCSMVSNARKFLFSIRKKNEFNHFLKSID